MATEFTSLNAAGAADIFLLLFIGVGPVHVLVPFIEATAGRPAMTRRLVLTKMLTTVAGVAIVLLALGEVLTRLLDFSTGALGISGGIILLIIAASLITGTGGPEGQRAPAGRGRPAGTGPDPLELAVYPLAIPYVLNPAGLVFLVTASAEAASVSVLAEVAAALAVVLVIDAVVLSLAARVSGLLNGTVLLVTDKVFAFLLAATAVQLVLDGLSSVGVIHLTHS